MATKRKQTRKHYDNRNDDDDFMHGIVEVEKVAIGGAIAVGTLGLLGGMMNQNH